MKLCTECRFCRMDGKAEFAKCVAPSNMVTSPVDGSQVPIRSYCGVAREDAQNCGPDGKWWTHLVGADASDEYDDEARSEAYHREERDRIKRETSRPR